MVVSQGQRQKLSQKPRNVGAHHDCDPIDQVHQRVPVANPRTLGLIGRHSQIDEQVSATTGATMSDRTR